MKRIVTIIAMLAFFVANLQAQIVGATNNSPRQKPEKTTRIGNNTRSKHYLQFEWEYYRGFRISYGYRINPNICIGAGLGSYIPVKDKYSLGNYTISSGFFVFTDATYSFTLNNEWSVFLKPRIDYRFHHAKSSYSYDFSSQFLLVTLQPGVSYKNFSLGIGRYGYSFGLSEQSVGGPIYAYLGINFIYSLPLKQH